MGGLFSKNKKVKTIDERDKVVLVSKIDVTFTYHLK